MAIRGGDRGALARLSALPAGERDAIVLAYFGGHNYREVAAMLDQSEGTIKSRIRGGLARIRSQTAELAADDR